MDSVVTTILALLEEISPILSEASTITKVINALIEIIPLIIKEAQDLVPVVKNIIAALATNPATTADQLKTLQDLDAKVDADFDAAAQAAEDEDKD